LHIDRCVGQAVAVTYPLDEIIGTEPDETPVVSRRRAVVILLSAALVAILVGLVAVAELRGFGTGGKHHPAAANPPAPITEAPIDGVPVPGDTAQPSAPPASALPPATGTHRTTAPPARPGTPQPTAPGAPVPPPPGQGTPPPPGACTGCEIPADSTVLVGTGPKAVRAGTYHSDGPSTADGCQWWLATDPDGNDQNAGRTVDHPTDVIVRDGLWFHSEGCQRWHWVGPV
jgi:hypothetical protein